MEADPEQRQWDTVAVYVLPLDIEAEELVGFVRPDNTNSRLTPVVAHSVVQAKVEVLQEEMESDPPDDHMDTGNVVRAVLVEAIQNIELLWIQEHDNEILRMAYEEAIGTFVEAMGRVVDDKPTTLDVYPLKNAPSMIKATEKDNVVLQKGELKTLETFVNGLKPGEVATVSDEVKDKQVQAWLQMQAYHQAVKATRQGAGTVSSLITYELGDLGSAIVREITRLEQFVASIDGSDDDATRYSKVNQDITRGLYHRVYRQIRDMKGHGDTKEASMHAIRQFLLTHVAGGGGEELLDIDAIRRVSRNLFSLSKGQHETPMHSLVGIDWMGHMQETDCVSLQAKVDDAYNKFVTIIHKMAPNTAASFGSSTYLYRDNFFEQLKRHVAIGARGRSDSISGSDKAMISGIRAVDQHLKADLLERYKEIKPIAPTHKVVEQVNPDTVKGLLRGLLDGVGVMMGRQNERFTNKEQQEYGMMKKEIQRIRNDKEELKQTMADSLKLQAEMVPGVEGTRQTEQAEMDALMGNRDEEMMATLTSCMEGVQMATGGAPADILGAMRAFVENVVGAIPVLIQREQDKNNKWCKASHAVFLHCITWKSGPPNQKNGPRHGV